MFPNPTALFHMSLVHCKTTALVCPYIIQSFPSVPTATVENYRKKTNAQARKTLSSRVSRSAAKSRKHPAFLPNTVAIAASCLSL